MKIQNERIVELAPIKESTSEYEQMEARIKATFRRLLYGPVLKELGSSESVLKNAVRNAKSKPANGLLQRIMSGQITYSEGAFYGVFEAESSRQLKLYGAKWDRATSSFKLSKADLKPEVREAISVSNVRYQERIKRIDKRLQQISPAEIAAETKTADLFARAAEKTDKLIAKSLKGSGIIPTLSAKEKQRIADEWQNNMNLWISNFTEDEIVRLRKDIAANVTTGDRHEAIVGVLQRSYGVTSNKAKFLARQETGLLMAKFKETRYTSQGLPEYKWGCVAGSKNHPVRPAHKLLENKIFRWDTPPITTPPGETVRRNNPGCDFGCRCFARPIVRFKSD